MSESTETPESPGLPERTGSHPPTLLRAPFATRPLPSYPNRTQYATFDPAFPPVSLARGSAHVSSNAPAPSPIERRAGSEPGTGWRSQNVDVHGRHTSIPPTLETASFILRERLPYPDRTLDEMTDWMSPPIVSPQSCASVPVTEADRWGPRIPDTPEDYAQWSENRPRPHAGRGYDRSNFTRHGGRDEPNETAAVANENVMESIELGSDPLVGMRSLANDLQARGRQNLNAQLRLEDLNQLLTERLARSNDNRRAFEQSRDELRGRLVTAEEERDRFQEQRDVAQNEVERLRLQIDEPEEELNQRREENEAFGQTLSREVGLQEQVRVLTQSEASLRGELQSATTRADQLQADCDRLEDDREQLELERNHFEDERDRQRDQPKRACKVMKTYKK